MEACGLENSTAYMEELELLLRIFKIFPLRNFLVVATQNLEIFY